MQQLETEVSIPSTNTNSETNFELKHRIVGAAFLLFFGALFLPWVLGPPTEAVKARPNDAKSDGTEVSSAQIENELLAALDKQAAAQPEQVYISKITPLDSMPKNASSGQITDPAAVNIQQPVTENKASGEKVASAKDQASTKGLTQAVGQKPSSAGARKEPANRAALPDPSKPLQAPQQAASAADLSSASSPEVDVGWVVQVGIYTNAQGVAKVVQDLRTKGFNPLTTVVDTNRGKSTGTRVWLGPFAQRVEAAKVKSRLTEKTGEAGFIRAYP